MEFEILPSARALLSVDQGNYDAEVGRIREISARYPSLVYSKVPLLTVQLVAIVRKGSKLRIPSADRLKDFRVGYIIGMSIAEDFALRIPSTATRSRLMNNWLRCSLRIALMLRSWELRSRTQRSTRLASLSSWSRSTLSTTCSMRNTQTGSAEFDRLVLQMKANGQYGRLLPAGKDEN